MWCLDKSLRKCLTLAKFHFAVNTTQGEHANTTQGEHANTTHGEQTLDVAPPSKFGEHANFAASTIHGEHDRRAAATKLAKAWRKRWHQIAIAREVNPVAKNVAIVIREGIHTDLRDDETNDVKQVKALQLSPSARLSYINPEPCASPGRLMSLPAWIIRKELSETEESRRACEQKATALEQLILEMQKNAAELACKWQEERNLRRQEERAFYLERGCRLAPTPGDGFRFQFSASHLT
mmetsp:Transcript_849/g.1408  ORF Transcript_849/g.1408 Transcript_849/m.1408 type:complete len:238 (+) Transcript_849:91-804(+)